MMPSHIFLLYVIISLICFWILLQLMLINKCFTEDDNHKDGAKSLCIKEKEQFLQQTLSLIHETECIKTFQDARNSIYSDEMNMIFIITPTYTRPVQKAELTRLSHTLLLVPKIHWIIVEDAVNKTSLVKTFLLHCGLSYTHLNVETPKPLKTTVEDPNWLKPRGVLQRNRGLTWLHENLSPKTRGVVYFADDDNTYDLKLFEEMRNTRTVSVWPVGLVGGLMVERPIVKNGKVIGWNTLWKTERPFPIDMAGFAINLTLLLQNKKAAFSIRVPRGYQESKLLKSLVTIDELEPKAEDCTKVLVWHTRTENPKLKQEKKLAVPSNRGIEV